MPEPRWKEFGADTIMGGKSCPSPILVHESTKYVCQQSRQASWPAYQDVVLGMAAIAEYTDFCRCSSSREVSRNGLPKEDVTHGMQCDNPYGNLPSVLKPCLGEFGTPNMARSALDLTFGSACGVCAVSEEILTNTKIAIKAIVKAATRRTCMYGSLAWGLELPSAASP